MSTASRTVNLCFVHFSPKKVSTSCKIAPVAACNKEHFLQHEMCHLHCIHLIFFFSIVSLHCLKNLRFITEFSLNTSYYINPLCILKFCIHLSEILKFPLTFNVPASVWLVYFLSLILHLLNKSPLWKKIFNFFVMKSVWQYRFFCFLYSILIFYDSKGIVLGHQQFSLSLYIIGPYFQVLSHYISEYRSSFSYNRWHWIFFSFFADKYPNTQ